MVSFKLCQREGDIDWVLIYMPCELMITYDHSISHKAGKLPDNPSSKGKEGIRSIAPIRLGDGRR